MMLKGVFVKSGEEAFAFDAFTTARLAEMGYSETVRDATGARVYESEAAPFQRIVRKPGYCAHSIVSFGSIVGQTLSETGWNDCTELSLEDFVNGAEPFAPAAQATVATRETAAPALARV